MEKFYVLTEETEDKKTIINGYKTKESAIKEMKWYGERAKTELDDGEDEPFVSETEDSYYVNDDMGKYFFYEITEIIPKD